MKVILPACLEGKGRSYRSEFYHWGAPTKAVAPGLTTESAQTGSVIGRIQMRKEQTRRKSGVLEEEDVSGSREEERNDAMERCRGSIPPARKARIHVWEGTI